MSVDECPDPRQATSSTSSSPIDLSEYAWGDSVPEGVVSYGVCSTTPRRLEVKDHLFGILLNPGVVHWGRHSSAPADLIFMARSFYFVPAGMTINVRKEHPTEFFRVLVKREWLDEEFRRCGFQPSTMIYNLTDADVSESALALRNQILRRDSAAALSAVDLFYKVISAVIRRSHSGPNTTQCRLTARQVRGALDYINSDISAPLSISDVAKATSGLSEFHFAHAFSNSLGQSLHQYIIERRLTQATKLLTADRLSLAEVAYATGFSSQAHMTETFRKRLNVTPGQFRRRSDANLCQPTDPAGP